MSSWECTSGLAEAHSRYRCGREFQKLLLVSLISQTGSHFLTLALGAYILHTSGSPMQAAMIYVVSYFPAILVSTPLGSWIDQHLSRWLYARNEIISILMTLLCGLVVYLNLPLALLCAVLAARSVLMFISRASATKWIKLISRPELQITRIKLFSLSFFLSTALSGLLAGIVLSRYSVLTVVGLDIASYLAGVILILLLRELPNSGLARAQSQIQAQSIRMRDTVRQIFLMQRVRVSFLQVCFSQALFQGAYTVLVSYLPLRKFEMGLSGVGSFQIAASIGITLGFAVIWVMPRALEERNFQRPIRALMAAAATCGAVALCLSSQAVILALGSFLALNLGYEIIWLHHTAEFFRASPKADAARYQFTLSSCASFLMALTTLAYSAGVQYLGLLPGIGIVLTLGAVLAVAASRGTRHSHGPMALPKGIPL